MQNTCVDFANESPEDAATAPHAQLRQFARSATQMKLDVHVLINSANAH